MNEIKVYKELSYIFCFDGNVYETPIPLTELENKIEGAKFLKINNLLINISGIKIIKEKKAGSMENRILSIKDLEKRELVKSKIKQRKKEGLRINLEILENIIKKF